MIPIGTVLHGRDSSEITVMHPRMHMHACSQYC